MIEIKGTVVGIFPTETFGKFEKRTFWVKEPDTQKYPNQFQLEVQGQKIPILNDVSVGDQVTCSINLRGRHYEKNGKEGVINTLECWKIETTAKAKKSVIEDAEEVNDLPF